MGAVVIKEYAGKLVANRKRVREQATISSHIRRTFVFHRVGCNAAEYLLILVPWALGGTLIGFFGHIDLCDLVHSTPLWCCHETLPDNRHSLDCLHCNRLRQERNRPGSRSCSRTPR
jgi:hypothetical protein